LFGVDPNAQNHEVTEEEIRMMVDVGQERGAIQESEKMMIDNIFEFNNKVVAEIMTHRINIVGIPRDASLETIVATINEEKYTRYPVYNEHIDDIVGILHVKDMMQFLINCEESKFDLTAFLRKPYHVPSLRRTDELFRDLQKKKVHMAIVIDEYGGTAGIVTIEDLVEEIVGNIFDEHDEEIRDFVKVDDHTYLANGTVSLDDIEDQFEIGLPIEVYETLSGFLIGQLGKLPDLNERSKVEWGGLTFQVEDADEKRIIKVRITAPPPAGEPGQA